MNDPIVKEVRQARDRLAARFGYDLDRLADHLERERKRRSRARPAAGRAASAALQKAQTGKRKLAGTR